MYFFPFPLWEKVPLKIPISFILISLISANEKIYGETQWYFSTLQTYWKFFPLAAIKEMGIKDTGIFNGTFSHNGNGKKYVNYWGNFIDELGHWQFSVFRFEILGFEIQKFSQVSTQVKAWVLTLLSSL